MLQQVVTKPGKIVFHEIPVPEAGPGEVLLRVMKIGLCASDVLAYHGTHPFTRYPVTQGHEASCEIVALGDGITEFELGQKVTVEPQVFCGKCHPCRHGRFNLCEELKVMGFQTTGLASEYFAVDSSKVTALSPDMTHDQGALIEPTAVAVHAVRRAGDITGKKVAVVGAGTIGNLVAQAAQAMGAGEVLITDLYDDRLKIARRCGIEHALKTRKKTLGHAMDHVFGPDRADVIFDCAGNDTTIGQAIKGARKGSTIILVAIFEIKATVDLATLNDHELTLDTSMMYQHDDYLEAIRLVDEGKIKLEPLISKTFPFRDYAQAYEYIEDNRKNSLKVLIDIQG